MSRRRKTHMRQQGRRPAQTVAQTPHRPQASRRRPADVRVDGQSWYRIENRGSGSDTTVIHIYDEIGYWGVTASDMVEDLRNVTTGTIELHLNSPGGEIFDGIAIYNSLRAHPAHVDVVVDSLAASAASFIAQAGDTVTMMPGSQMMIHGASGLCIGNARDMAEMATMLDRQTDNIASIYASAGGGTVAEWRERMEAETWYSAEEAVEAGLADQVSSGRPATPEDRARGLPVAPARNARPAQAAPASDAPADPLPDPDELFEFDWDADMLSALTYELTNHAPAPPVPDEPPPPPPEPEINIDTIAFRNALREGLLQ